MATFDMKDFARRGAEARIAELNAEIEAIYGAFPDLRGRGARKLIKVEETGTGSTRSGRGEHPGRRRRRRKMTAAERKAVGERMKKYWAARRAESAAKKR